MKKILLITFLFPAIAFSQSLGLKLGPTFSSASGHSSTTRLNVGLIYTHNFNKFQITIEPSFTQKGYSDKLGFTDPNGNPINDKKANFRLNYLDLPVAFGFTPLNEKVILGFNAGFAPCILLSSTYSYPNYKSDIKGLNTFNLDFIAGAKVGYKLSDNLFANINLRYGMGLLNLNDSGTINKYRYFSPFLEIGYKF